MLWSAADAEKHDLKLIALDKLTYAGNLAIFRYLLATFPNRLAS